MMKRGKLIVLESMDAGGKSTQTKEIQKYLDQKGLTHASFHFPMYGHNQFSKAISMFLKGEFGDVDEVDPLFVATLYAMDRFRFLPELEKALEEKDVVILDRYVFSNIAYQCAKYETEEDKQRMMDWITDFEFSFLGLPYPDINLYLDLPIKEIQKRLGEKREGKDREYLEGKSDIHEADITFQERVRNSYLDVMMRGVNCKIIPCTYTVGKEEEYFVLYPHDLFLSYKKYLDYVLFDETK